MRTLKQSKKNQGNYFITSGNNTKLKFQCPEINSGTRPRPLPSERLAKPGGFAEPPQGVPTGATTRGSGKHTSSTPARPGPATRCHLRPKLSRGRRVPWRRVPLLRALARGRDGAFGRRHLSSPGRTAPSSAPPPAAACSACRRSIWKRGTDGASLTVRHARASRCSRQKVQSQRLNRNVLLHVNLNSQNYTSV